MPASKTAKTLLASQTLAAGASVNLTEWDMTAAYGGSIFIKITNGSSAPTTAPTVRFFAGEASGVKRQRFVAAGDTTNSSVNEIECEYG